jgi:hypothetical protein
MQVALPPPVAETLRPALAESRILTVGGIVERSAGHVTLLARRLQAYQGSSSERVAAERGRQSVAAMRNAR